MAELIRREKMRLTMMGRHPTRITMTQRMRDILADELREYADLIQPGYGMKEIYGLEIEVRNDLDNGVMFIIS